MQDNNLKPAGINFPSVDKALEGVVQTNESIEKDAKKKAISTSKYALVAYASARANQIAAYNAGIDAGHLNAVGPVVPSYYNEKPLSIAMREIAEGKINCDLQN
jgi:DNA-directed RNA polymerase subunit omega